MHFCACPTPNLLTTIHVFILSLPFQIKPLHDAYQAEVSTTLWEPLNTFWAECYEACKSSSQKRAKQLMESRRKFQVSQTKEFNGMEDRIT